MKAFKVILAVLLTLAVTAGAVLLIFTYEMRWKVTDVDRSTAPDGVHTVVLKAKGEAEFPFGPAPGHLVLKEGKKTLAKADFCVYDDGGSLRHESWEVRWEDGFVLVLLHGDEQNDDLVVLYFDGAVDKRTLNQRGETFPESIPILMPE